ncbi:MAG: HAD hydrolase-like protein, partial [Planctomycetota bacterium]
MISAVIFDLDGLLADTEQFHRSAYQAVFSELGFELSDELYEDHWIRCGRGIDAFVLEHNLSADPQLIRRRKARRYER